MTKIVNPNVTVSAARASGQTSQAKIRDSSIGPWVRAAALPEWFCSWDLAYRCTKAGWLRPVLQGKRRTIYRITDVLACIQRIEAGEMPASRRSQTKA